MTNLLHILTTRWSEPSGYKDVLTFSIPLIVTTSIYSLQTFVDRLFLSQYSSDAIAASVPAGLIAMSLTSVFIGLASYIGVFVSQFYGARQFDKIAKMVWQGVYSIVPAVFVVVPAWWFIPDLIRWVGHDPLLQAMETDYAQILVIGIPIFMLNAGLSGFLTGQGKVAALMWVSVAMTVVNYVLDYVLIFGRWGFPALGIRGAGWATIFALLVAVLIMLAIFFSKKNRRTFGTSKQWRFDPQLFKRLLRFGLPVGFQFQLESLAMMVFVLIVGGIGVLELTAHSIVMNIFMVLIMPMAGMSAAVAILVGQRLGEGSPELAQKVTSSAAQLAIPVFIVIAALLFLVPHVFIQPFSYGMSAELSITISPLIADLLKGAALFCLFDVIFMLYSGALRGAGDTRFVALVGIFFSWFVLVIPTVVVVNMVDEKLRWAWLILVLYMFALALMCYWRFCRGHWKKALLI